MPGQSTTKYKNMVVLRSKILFNESLLMIGKLSDRPQPISACQIQAYFSSLALMVYQNNIIVPASVIIHHFRYPFILLYDNLHTD